MLGQTGTFEELRSEEHPDLWPPAFRARSILKQIQSLKTFDQLMESAATPKAKVGRVISLFEQNPKWLTDPPTDIPAGLLIKAAMDNGGPDNVAVFVANGWIAEEYATKNAKAIVAEMSKQGREKVMATGVISAMVPTREAGLAPLLEDWLAAETHEEKQRELISALFALGGRDYLMDLLKKEERFGVIRWTINRLSGDYPDDATRKLLNALIVRLQKAGNPEKEVNYVRATLQGITPC